MVANFDESRMLGELQDLEDEIALIEIIHNGYLMNKDVPEISRQIRVCYRLLERLRNDKYHQEMRLRIHRQKVEESGVKY